MIKKTNLPLPEMQNNTRQKILSIAQEIILGKGFSAVGINEILKTAGVPKGSFYHYFESKEQFGCALLQNYFQHYLSLLDAQLIDNGRPALTRLRDYFKNWQANQCSDTSKDKCLVVKLSGEVTDLSEAMRLALMQGTQQVIDRIATCMNEAIAVGDISIDTDAQIVTKEIYYLWVGATLLTKVNNTPDALNVAMNATCQRLGVTH